MIYEFIATISAGFGMAGLALIIRHLTKLAGKQAPKWLIPIFAGIGMLGFQIHQEYNWQDQQISKLPEGVSVIKVVEGHQWFRPWSYVKPQVIRFMAVSDGTNIRISKDNSSPLATDDIKQFNIYLFERRISTKIIPQLVNCTKHTMADPVGNSSSNQHSDTSENPAKPASTSQLPLDELNWKKLKKDDEIIVAVCH